MTCRFQFNAKHLQLSATLNLLLFFNFSHPVNAQDKNKSSIVKADRAWHTEMIPCPADWLPKLTFKGFEELRFTPKVFVNGYLRWLWLSS